MAFWNRNRGIGKDGYGALKSGRIGVGGQRTFHCHFTSVRVGGGTGAVDYLERAGDFEKKAADLEIVVGDPDQVREAADLVDQVAVKRNGRTAEKVLVKLTFELPAEMTDVQRQLVAEKLVAQEAAAGRIAVAAIHGNGVEQPHIHLATTARPVDLSTKNVCRDPTRVFLRGGKAALRAERARVARVINGVLGQELFHPGRLADTGIDRPAQKRLPQRLWHSLGQRQIDPAAVEAARKRKEAERAEAARRRKEQAAAIKARLEKQPHVQDLRKQIHFWRDDQQETQVREFQAKADAANAQAKADAMARRLRALSEKQTELFKDLGIDPPAPGDAEALGRAFAQVRQLLAARRQPLAPQPRPQAAPEAPPAPPTLPPGPMRCGTKDADQKRFLAALRAIPKAEIERRLEETRAAVVATKDQDAKDLLSFGVFLARQHLVERQAEPDPPPPSPAPQPGRPGPTRKPQKPKDFER